MSSLTAVSQDDLILTPQAIQKIQALVKRETNETPLRLRVTITGGGCSGFQYHFDLDAHKEDEDLVFQFAPEAEVIVDPVSFNIIKGAKIDYVENLMGAAFVMNIPNAVSACGCGSSFAL